METQDMKLRTTGQPELNLLLPQDAEKPLWKSLFQNIDDLVFPKKLPPLKLTSRPEPVRDIWGFYNYSKRGAYGSTIVHTIEIAGLIRLSLLDRRGVAAVKKHAAVTQIRPP